MLHGPRHHQTDPAADTDAPLASASVGVRIPITVADRKKRDE